MNTEFNIDNFNELMDEFTKLSIAEQRQHIVNEIKWLIDYASKICMVNQTLVQPLYNKEIDDLNKANVEEKDYLEAIYAYIYILKQMNTSCIKSFTSNIIKCVNEIMTNKE